MATTTLKYAPVEILDALGIPYDTVLPQEVYDAMLVGSLSAGTPMGHVVWAYPEGSLEGMPWPVSRTGALIVQDWAILKNVYQPELVLDIQRGTLRQRQEPLA